MPTLKQYEPKIIEVRTMHYFDSNESNLRHKLSPFIGEPLQSGIKGSTSYFIKQFEADTAINLLNDSKGIFQAYTKGLLLITFKSNRSLSIPIPYQQIKKLVLLKGQETIDPFFPSVMWMLLKLDVRIEIARYFRMHSSEYSIEPILLEIQTDSYLIHLETNGYTFQSQEAFFSQLTEIEKLRIIKSAPIAG
ncbi:hypothetical protein C9994_12415 [Marivirga lumbricoides]|uniref:Uncharacterized protein n=1 Tax=Marivirga lumbricoides TaxID=1046115 RepID=A0A2T4DJS7_9BACT|nr:hypothetical protein C9994_12415 [Marivirga lumbricoides]